MNRLSVYTPPLAPAAYADLFAEAEEIKAKAFELRENGEIGDAAALLLKGVQLYNERSKRATWAKASLLHEFALTRGFARYDDPETGSPYQSLSAFLKNDEYATEWGAKPTQALILSGVYAFYVAAEPLVSPYDWLNGYMGLGLVAGPLWDLLMEANFDRLHRVRKPLVLGKVELEEALSMCNRQAHPDFTYKPWLKALEGDPDSEAEEETPPQWRILRNGPDVLTEIGTLLQGIPVNAPFRIMLQALED